MSACGCSLAVSPRAQCACSAVRDDLASPELLGLKGTALLPFCTIGGQTPGLRLGKPGRGLRFPVKAVLSSSLCLLSLFNPTVHVLSL